MNKKEVSVYMEKVKCPLFHAHYDIIVGYDHECINKQITDIYPGISLQEEINQNTLGYAFSVKHHEHGFGFSIMINLGAQDNPASPGIMSTIIHECLHLTWFMMDGVGVKVDGSNHEVQCYLLEEFVRETNRVIDIAKQKISLDSL